MCRNAFSLTHNMPHVFGHLLSFFFSRNLSVQQIAWGKAYLSGLEQADEGKSATRYQMR